MLQEALCTPGDDDIYYHYCTAATFQAICEGKAIRFSDASMMNDAAELVWGRETLTAAAPLVIKLRETLPELKDLDARFFATVALIYEQACQRLHPFIAAFSRQPDVLSQWRAYADNGQGFSVGISGKALKNLPAALYGVVYNRDDQLRQARDALGILYLSYKDQATSPKAKGLFFDMTASLTGSLLAFKNPQFSEEQEIRCVHLVNIADKGGGPVFTDDDGNNADGEIEGEPIKYRVNQGSLIAYFDLPLNRGFPGQAIREVWLGPKNPNEDKSVALFLNASGLGNVPIKRSTATYR
jgi:hypothetical protein